MRQTILVCCATAATISVLSVFGVVSAEDCVAPVNDWFPSGGATPETDYTKKPDPKVDCDFYKIGWQTFLFATQPDPKVGPQPRFVTYVTPDQLFEIPYLLGFPKRKETDKFELVLTPRLRKPTHSNDLGSINQAVENGVIVDQNGRALYYGLHLNPKFADFIKNNGFTNLAKFGAANPTLEFPVGAVEFKSAWRIVPTDEPSSITSKFLTMDARLAKLGLDSKGNVVVDPTQSITEKVALVGLHVVVRVEGHPEFIWVTFEHIDNAPDLPMRILPGDSKPVGDPRWTFCPEKTLAKDCNQNPRKDALRPLRFVDQGKQLLEPKTPVFREFAFGGDDPRAIISLTTSVHSALPPKLAIWKNYEMIGAVWLDDPAKSFKENRISFDDSELAGSTMLSNATMETFTQHQPNGSPENCFTCHTTGPVVIGTQILKGKRLNISHALNNSFVLGMAAQKEKKK